MKNMKKTYFMLLLSCLFTLTTQAKKENDPRLIIITFDGLRWQELFTGADSSLVGNKTFVEKPEVLRSKYWRESQDERRKLLMPFTWSYIKDNGFMVGNRNIGSQMQVANKKNYSYPGYSENFCGYPDDERVDSNDPIPNHNRSVFEVANQDPRYHNNLMVYGSWESIRYAVNNERGGFKASASYEKNVSSKQDATMQLLDEMLDGMPHIWGEERFDAFTYAYALQTLKNDHPKVMWISFGDTDEWAHDGRYDFYLDAINGTDKFIKRIVETCEADPFYKGKTTYMLTCDHGRGYAKAFTSHGARTKGSQNTWFMVFGKGIEPLGETSSNGPFYNQQVAATVANVLGIDFTPDNGVKQQPIDPHYKGVPLEEDVLYKDCGYFPAVEATPAGNGVKYAYYEGKFKSVDHLNDAPILETGTLNNFSIKGAKVDDHFGYTFETLLKIPVSGKYILSLSSDDGSKLWIDDKLVADNDGSHSYGSEDIIIEFEAGYHRVFVKYFEDTEECGLNIGLNGCGINVDNIPDDMLFLAK